MSEVRKLVDVVRGAIDRGAETAEEIHKAVAALPLSVIDTLEVFPQSVEEVRRVQDLSIGAVYDLIRDVNHQVTNLASEVIEAPSAPRSAKAHRGARRRKARQPAKRASTKSAGARRPPPGP